MFASRESAAAPADAVDAGEHAGRGHRIAKAPLHAGPCEQPQEHGPVWAPASGSQRARKSLRPPARFGKSARSRARAPSRKSPAKPEPAPEPVDMANC